MKMSRLSIKLSEPEWTKENILKLFAALKSSVPAKYSKAVYSSGLKHVDWNKVAFPPFSPEACQQKWKDVLQKLQKTRTLTELIDDAEKTISSSDSKREGEHNGMPQKPPMNGYQLFCKDQLPLMRGVPSEYVKVWAKRWNELTNSEKAEYSKRCKKLKEKYAAELKDYLATLNKEEQEQILSENSLTSKYKRKHSKKNLDKSCPVEPKMPARSNNSIFCKRQMELLREECPNARERFTKVNKMWRGLSTQEKESYKEQVDENFRRYSVALQEWFMALSPSEQEDYRKRNPSKCQYLCAKKTKNNDTKEEAYVYIPSDSEDEVMESSSSEEEEDNSDSDEEEEEDDDMAFNIY